MESVGILQMVPSISGSVIQTLKGSKDEGQGQNQGSHSPDNMIQWHSFQIKMKCYKNLWCLDNRW